MSPRWSHFSLIWAMGKFLIGNSIPETVHEFVIGIALGCCFDEIKKLTKFDSYDISLFRTLRILNVLAAQFKFNFSAKPLLMSVESDPLSRNASL